MLLVFLICSKGQISQCERESFCIADSQQLGVTSLLCTDHKVSATSVCRLLILHRKPKLDRTKRLGHMRSAGWAQLV